VKEEMEMEGAGINPTYPKMHKTIVSVFWINRTEDL